MESPRSEAMALPVLGPMGVPRARRWTAGLSALIALAAFFPLKPGYGGPIRLPNHVEVSPSGVLRFTGPAVCRTPGATDWAREAISAQELDLSFQFRSASPKQMGPARLITLSDGAFARNFMVAQKGVDLLVRARRDRSDKNGAPPLKVDGVFKGAGPESPMHTLLVRFRPDVIEIMLDGTPVYREKQEASPFLGWDASYRFAVGNEVDGARGWRGEIAALQLRVADQVFDPLARGDLEMPSSHWHVPERARRLLRFDPSHAVPTAAVHMAVFVPLGALMWLGRQRRAHPGIARVALAAALFGALVQLGKLAFEARHPSLYHALPNGVGALIGAGWIRARMRAGRGPDRPGDAAPTE